MQAFDHSKELKYCTMKSKLMILFFITASTAGYTQSTNSQKFPLVIQFASHCCGVPSDSTVINYINCFKKSNKIGSISAYRVGPMGREGEYYLAFPLDELNEKKARKFINDISCVTIAKDDKGGINFEKDFTIDNSRFSKPVMTEANVVKF